MATEEEKERSAIIGRDLIEHSAELFAGLTLPRTGLSVAQVALAREGHHPEGALVLVQREAGVRDDALLYQARGKLHLGRLVDVATGDLQEANLAPQTHIGSQWLKKGPRLGFESRS